MRVAAALGSCVAHPLPCAKTGSVSRAHAPRARSSGAARRHLDVPRPEKARSRRAGGVGDVAGERGGRQGVHEPLRGRHRQEWREHFDPNGVWDASASQLPAAGVYHGHEGIVAQGRPRLPKPKQGRRPDPHGGERIRGGSYASDRNRGGVHAGAGTARGRPDQERGEAYSGRRSGARPRRDGSTQGSLPTATFRLDRVWSP
jgi:hypothetical protein